MMETPATVQAPHSEIRNITERDGDIVLSSSSLCHFLSLVNEAIASQCLPWGLELDTSSFNEE